MHQRLCPASACPMRLASASPRGVGRLTTSPAASAIPVLPQSPDLAGMMGIVAPRTKGEAVVGASPTAADGLPEWLGFGQALARVPLGDAAFAVSPTTGRG